MFVGYDGSDGSKRAVLWAARYARVAKLPLVVVHCWVWSFFTQDLGPVTGIQDNGLRREAPKLVAEGHDLAANAEPGLDVRKRLIVGFPPKRSPSFRHKPPSWSQEPAASMASQDC